MQTSPILVTGSFRSGTTWVGKMIALSDKVKYIAEPFNTINGYLYGVDFEHQFYRIEEEETSAYLKNVKNAIGLKYNLGDLLRRVEYAPDLKHKAIALGRYFLFKKYKLQNVRPLVKDPMAIMSAEWLHKTFNTQNIVIIRHPAAFIYSLERMNWGFDVQNLLKQPGLMNHLTEFKDELEWFAKRTYEADRIKGGILIWNIFHKIILEYKKNYPSWMFFTHEELSKDPHSYFKSIYKNLGLKFNENISRQIEEFTNKNNPAEAKPKEAFVLKRNSEENVGIWKQKLKDHDIKKIFDGTEKISSHFYSSNDW